MRKLLPLLSALLFSITLFPQVPHAAYPLDGNAADVSGNNFAGTITGTPIATANRFNQPSTSLTFNGTTDYITLPDDFDFTSRSIVAWFYPTTVSSANSNAVYTSDHPGLQNGLSIILTQTRNGEKIIRLECDQFAFNCSVNINTWYQAAITRTPTAVKLYLNGALVYSGANPDGTRSSSGTSSKATVGASRNFDHKFIGRIDDVTIYNTLLTDSAIHANYNAGSYRYTDTTHYTIIDTTHIILHDTMHVTVTDTSYIPVAVTDTLYINTVITGSSAITNLFKVYPNPSNSHIYIDNGNYDALTAYTVKISNALGQPVFTSTITLQQFYIPLNSWTGPGNYILQIFDPELHVIVTKTIILQ